MVSEDEEMDILEPSPHMQQLQRLQFNKIEWHSRAVNAALTPLEMTMLNDLAVSDPNTIHPKDIQKIIKFFGQAKGGTAPAKRVLHKLAQMNLFNYGERVDVTGAIFPVCKHLLLADRASYPVLEEGPRILGCSCLAATWFMPEGCVHRKAAVYSKSVSECGSLCNLCSKCLRCGKLPVKKLFILILHAF